MSLYFRHLRVICWPKLPQMPALSLSLTHTLFLSLLLCSVAVFISCLCQLQIFFNFLAKIRYKLIALVAGKERRDVAAGTARSKWGKTVAYFLAYSSSVCWHKLMSACVSVCTSECVRVCLQILKGKTNHVNDIWHVTLFHTHTHKRRLSHTHTHTLSEHYNHKHLARASPAPFLLLLLLMLLISLLLPASSWGRSNVIRCDCVRNWAKLMAMLLKGMSWLHFPHSTTSPPSILVRCIGWCRRRLRRCRRS